MTAEQLVDEKKIVDLDLPSILDNLRPTVHWFEASEEVRASIENLTPGGMMRFLIAFNGLDSLEQILAKSFLDKPGIR